MAREGPFPQGGQLASWPWLSYQWQAGGWTACEALAARDALLSSPPHGWITLKRLTLFHRHMVQIGRC